MSPDDSSPKFQETNYNYSVLSSVLCAGQSKITTPKQTFTYINFGTSTSMSPYKWTCVKSRRDCLMTCDPWIVWYVATKLCFVRAGSWLSLHSVRCSQSAQIPYNICYETNTGMTCFTYFTQVRSYKNAKKWCEDNANGSSLVVIKSAEDQQIVENFTSRHALNDTTIIIDAQQISANESQNWSWVNGHQSIPEGNNSLSIFLFLDIFLVQYRTWRSAIETSGMNEWSVKWGKLWQNKVR